MVHALVRTDNLLGPRHALGGVRDQLGVIDTLLRSVRPPIRHRVLELGAKYAESAAWLHEDSGDMNGARYWTGRSMEWALEAGDRLMMSWVLFRRGEHAAAGGDAAAVAGLAAAARREGKNLPGPMLAAVLQQEAHAYALDGDEAACQAALDQAHRQAASPDDPGDASNGHGSFCTPAYVEMQRRGIEALPADTSEARQLRLNADAVLGTDGSVQEAVPGSHGKGILALMDPAGTNVAEAAAALYDSGVRRLLLDGGLDAAKPFLDSGLVDRVTAYLAHENPSRRPAAELPWPLLPPGFMITCAARAGSFVRVEGQQDALR